MTGYAAAAVVVLIWASYPVATRAGVTSSFTPQDLMALRFGVGALFFLPYFALRSGAISRHAWLRGVPLTLFQGAGMAALVIYGLQFAPANHAAALGPGVAPAWVALLGFLLFSRRPSPRVITGSTMCAIGVATLVAWSSAATRAATLAGDLMFIGASALGALYVLQLRSWGIGVFQGAAIVTLYSALIVVPWQFGPTAHRLLQLAPLELLWQVLWQGVLIGCVGLIALNHAIERLGPERSIALVALVPALSTLLGAVFLREIPSAAEIVAILAVSAGVSLSASQQRAARPSISAVRQPATR